MQIHFDGHAYEYREGLDSVLTKERERERENSHTLGDPNILLKLEIFNHPIRIERETHLDQKGIEVFAKYKRAMSIRRILGPSIDDLRDFFGNNPASSDFREETIKLSCAGSESKLSFTFCKPSTNSPLGEQASELSPGGGRGMSISADIKIATKRSSYEITRERSLLEPYQRIKDATAEDLQRYIKLYHPHPEGLIQDELLPRKIVLLNQTTEEIAKWIQIAEEILKAE